jgi:hypothetical protein
MKNNINIIQNKFKFIINKLYFNIFGVKYLKKSKIVVSFTGGMGAQILSAAIYFDLIEKGYNVYADFSYFNRKEHLAVVGNIGEISLWSWSLDSFGLSMSSFNNADVLELKIIKLIVDGPKKLALAINALSQEKIRNKFPISSRIDDILPRHFESGYICVHIRRGDYVNVSSFLLSDNEFIKILCKLNNFNLPVVIVSDSPLINDFRSNIGFKIKRVIFYDNIDAYTTHRIMRNSNIFVGSNSQFSLIAAILNSKALNIVPKKWFGNEYYNEINPVNLMCNFQLLD